MVTKKKVVAKKVTVSRAKPFTKQKKVVPHQRVQTAEGWKRQMLKIHKMKATKTQ